MGFKELTQERYSSRQYLDKPVEKEKVEAILEAGRIAPTAKNLQPARVIVVESKEGMDKIAKTSRLYGATLAPIIVADSERAWVRPFDGKNYGDIDATIVTTQMMYEAQELGLGSVWIGYFDPKVIKEEFGLAENEEASSILAIGYRADETSANHGKRNPMDVFASRA